MENKLETRFGELATILSRQSNREGFWTGELSSSALGTAVAIAALHFNDSQANSGMISGGIDWLLKNINADGSYGDTPDSPGNISTTLLVYSAVNLYASKNESLRELQGKMADYLLQHSIDVRSEDISGAILAHYKKDYTFSVPILVMCALCGIPPGTAFRRIPQLPFELSLLPRKFYRLLNLSVVSYAIPALIAVGIVIFRKKNSGFLLNLIRSISIRRSLEILRKMMPESGGFLEAVPLTAFVSLSLIHAGYKDTETVRKGTEFLKRTCRADGSWPIDIDLSSWVTTLSIKALRTKIGEVLSKVQRDLLADHLLSVQNRGIHPFNGTGPGGWGWTNFPGSVPDGDDTAGAMISLMELQPKERVRNAVLAGCDWLLKLQNYDGGFPTFSKGWGKLPFDKSSPDVTGHCVLAVSKSTQIYGAEITGRKRKRYERMLAGAVNYLIESQSAAGSWLPLWFGNQLADDHLNPVYGTARVLTYLLDAGLHERRSGGLEKNINGMIRAGTAFLLDACNEDGSWGGDKAIEGTIEETSLAISALTGTGHADSCRKGLSWLDQYYRKNGLKPAPIGLYFASLWYHERLYPLTAYLEAITRSLENDNQEFRSDL
jgi:squalene-hopene/tetraprenyl-beta-curcumene cyclase